MLKLPETNLNNLWNDRLDFFVPDGFIVRTGSIETLHLYKKFFQMFFCLMQILIGPI